MWAWVFDYPDFRMRTDFGWSGTMSLPRVLSLGADGGLRMDVPEENTRRSSLGAGPKSVEAGPFSLGEQEPLRLRIFVDKSIVEVFANGRQAAMRRIYPSRLDSLGVRVFAGGASARLTRASVWKLRPTNPY
jgi:sucrose-6-phosphate hydrolase SacC (GH32 family)